MALLDVRCFAAFAGDNQSALLLLPHLLRTALLAVVVRGAPSPACPGLLLVARDVEELREVMASVAQPAYAPPPRHDSSPGLLSGGAPPAPTLAVLAHEPHPERCQVPAARGRSDLSALGDPLMALVAAPGPRALVADVASGRWVALARAPQLLVEARRRMRRWPDLRGRALVVPASNVPPFTYNDTGEGLENRFVRTLAEVLGMTLAPISLIPTKYGYQWDSIMEMLVMGVGDVSVGAFPAIQDVQMLVELGYPWGAGCLTMLAPRPLQESRGDAAALLRPLAPAVWLALLALLAVAGAALEAAARASPRPRPRPHAPPSPSLAEQIRVGGGGGRRVQMWLRRGPRPVLRPGRGWSRSGHLEALGALLAAANTPASPAPHPPARRALLLLCNVAGIVLVTAYNSELLAHLTAPRFPPPVDSFEHFLAAGLRWGTTVPIPKGFFNRERPVEVALKNRYERLADAGALSARVRGGQFAAPGLEVGGVFCPLGDPPDRDLLSRLRVMAHCLRTDMFALAYPKRSALRPWGDRVVSLLREAGLDGHWLREALRRRVDPALLQVSHASAPHGTTSSPSSSASASAAAAAPPEKLKPAALASAFALLAAGLAAAAAAAAAELLAARCARRAAVPKRPRTRSSCSCCCC